MVALHSLKLNIIDCIVFIIYPSMELNCFWPYSGLVILLTESYNVFSLRGTSKYVWGQWYGLIHIFPTIFNVYKSFLNIYWINNKTWNIPTIQISGLFFFFSGDSMLWTLPLSTFMRLTVLSLLLYIYIYIYKLAWNPYLYLLNL